MAVPVWESAATAFESVALGTGGDNVNYPAIVNAGDRARRRERAVITRVRGMILVRNVGL